MKALPLHFGLRSHCCQASHCRPTSFLRLCRALAHCSALLALHLPGMVLLVAALLVPGWARPCAAQESAGSAAATGNDIGLFASEEDLDLHCLRASYPAVQGVRTDGDGARWLELAGGRSVLYAPAGPASATLPDGHVVDVRTSMQARYPLEPLRPQLPRGFSPGRWRSLDLLMALYGDNEGSVRKNLGWATFLGQWVALSPPAARALEAVGRELAPLAQQDRHIRSLLRSNGGFTWRRVDGETYLSPHAFGIAIDISAHVATYWRWSSLRPHPLQQDYPQAIVEAFERQGFIWGGKWEEYDLMHFEYRPELVCKARALRDNRLQAP